MIRLVPLLGFVWLVLAAAGCSSGSGGADAGVDGGPDAGEDAGADTGADIGLGEDFGLLVPQGQQACTMDRVYVTRLEDTFRHTARVTLRPGLLRLPRDGAVIEFDWIDKLEVGPEAKEAAALTAGRFDHSTQQDGDSVIHRYDYSQQFEAGGEAIDVTFTVLFEEEGGVAAEPTAAIDEAGLTERRFSFSLAGPGWLEGLDSCTFALYPCYTHRFGIEGGDFFQIEQCNHCPGDWDCNSDPGGLARARFVHDGQTRDVADPFCLAHTMRQHNWGADHLVRLEDPPGGVHAVYLGAEDYPDHNDYLEIHYLDAAYQTIETRAVLSHETGDW